MVMESLTWSVQIWLIDVANIFQDKSWQYLILTSLAASARPQEGLFGLVLSTKVVAVLPTRLRHGISICTSSIPIPM